MEPIKLHYSEKIVKGAVLTFWLRSTGLSFFIPVIAVLGYLIYLIAIGDHSWVVGLLGSTVAFGLIVSIVLYLSHYRASMRRFRRLQSPEGQLELTEIGFQITSDRGSLTIRWDEVQKIWRLPNFWLVFISAGQFITLPSSDLNPAARAFITNRAEACHVRLE